MLSVSVQTAGIWEHPRDLLQSSALKACSGRTRGAKNRDRGAHFDRRVLAVDAEPSHFFSRRAPADREERSRRQ